VDRVRGRAWIAVGVAAVMLAAAGTALAIGLGRHGLPPVTGDRLDRTVPDMTLTDQDGRQVSLADFRGKVVVLAPILTLCAEVCPITTGAFLQMTDAVRRAGLARRVVFVEATVDPGRDDPARLKAYARMTGASWTLLTGSADQVHRFWSFFGVGYFTQPEPSPPTVDWLTGELATYDVAHSDGLFFLDAQGHERIVIVGAPTVGPNLLPRLKRLLDAEGLRELAHPHAPWTVPQALDDLGNLLGTRISLPSGAPS
jgi:cytochrome oxidase Cu insertion factor (SCO1/SenC/PrrC family)